MTNNVSAVMDPTYNYSMWVEVINMSTLYTYNLSSYYFTNDIKVPKKWCPASQSVLPGGIITLWFEREDIAGHANFKLNPQGGKLFMVNTAGLIVDSITYPVQYRNVSYGRQTDGNAKWVYFDQYSPGASNNGKLFTALRCGNPVFAVNGGLYSSTVNFKFQTPAAGDTIYWTNNGAEPTKANGMRYIPESVISIAATTCIRARTFGAGKLASDIATNTYFIGERNFHLPVVSIVTEQANLTDNTIGIYVQGTNGLTGNGMSTPANWNQDWDRPANLEVYDSAKVSRINQEVDIQIAGGWTRMNGQKTLKLNPKEKHGNNKLDYDFFKSSKPGMKYKSILFRNSGNDFSYSMFRDALMNTIVAKRLDLEWIAYEPAVCFMNGTYYGIQNLRERSDVDMIYSNYGYNEDEIVMVESWEATTNADYKVLSNYITLNDITQDNVYTNIGNLMDVDEFLNYFMTQIYYGNTDWPANNVKTWKTKVNGKWRWILYDTDFGFSLYNTTLYDHNSLLYALGELSGSVPDAWSTLIFRRLVLNEKFKNKLIDRFCVQISSTFEPERINHIIDSLSAKISTEINYHKTKWGSSRGFAADVSNMKAFAANRPTKMLGFLSARFLNSAATQNIQINANIPNANYTLNEERINDKFINLKYFNGRTMNLKANNIPGYNFKNWELITSVQTNTLIAYGNIWSYFDGNGMPAANWYAKNYTDSGWKTGASQLGYGGKGEATTIGYGGHSSAKYTTAYFRKTINISNLSDINSLSLTGFVDDGAVVYVNGTEIGRYNMPGGTVNFATLATGSNNGAYFTLAVPTGLLTEGANVVAVEVHQNAASSSDLISNLQLTGEITSASTINTNQIYTATITGDMKLKAVYEENNVVDEPATVLINEIVSSNSIIQDEFLQTEDYFELYNFGEKEMNIGGWFISDVPGNKTLYRIPDTDPTKTTIPAKGFLLLWADNQPEQGILHIGCKLSREGETLVLSKYNKFNTPVMVDSVSFPLLEQNFSYARKTDGNTNWVIQTITPGLTNILTGNNEMYAAEVKVYPTVARDNFIVQNAQKQTITMFDMTGKVVIQKQAGSYQEQIFVSQLNQGMYIVQVGNEKFRIIKL